MKNGFSDNFSRVKLGILQTVEPVIRLPLLEHSPQVHQLYRGIFVLDTVELQWLERAGPRSAISRAPDS